MEHRIDIEEGTANVGLNCIVQKIKEDLSGLPVLDSNCYIHRVGEGLRKTKREAYEPMVVSIGPYHLKNSKLKAMKKHKLRYLHLLLERTKENVDTYVEELKKLEDNVRKCYVDPFDDDLKSEEFVEMMLLDACFIIEFFRKKLVNPILNVDYMENQICRDLMLLENQLPFFLLSHFYDMVIKNPDDVPESPKPDPDKNPNNGLLQLIIEKSSFLKNILPLPCHKYCLKDPGEIKHLLHLVHLICRPSSKQTESSETINTKTDEQDDDQQLDDEQDYEQLDDEQDYEQRMLADQQDDEQVDDEQVDDEQQLDTMHSAVELEEAGVKFMVNSKYHLFDKKFEDGLMELPCLCVEDSTDTFFRNLIAFEQHSMDIDPKYFTDYMHFMDELINSEKDAKLLRDKGIIVNYLGEDKKVSDLFNKLGDGVIVSYPTFYHDMFSQVNRYYNEPWHSAMATFWHDYFNTPWASISTMGAIVILVLTLLQTIESFEN